MITKEDVLLGYKALLNRLPESDDIILQSIEKYANVENLLKAIVQSIEFEQLYSKSSQGVIMDQWGFNSNDIDVNVVPNQMNALHRRVQAVWQTLGAADPFWSVLIDEQYRTSNITEERKREFFATGLFSSKLIEKFAAETQSRLKRGSCFELGCGVGRVTYYLSKMFDKVVAADISEGNLRVCKEYLESQGVNNVEFLLVKSLDDITTCKSFDFFYSIIVLQHNPPPLQAVILNSLVSKINAGGGCFFQTPGALPNYSFRIAEYLSRSTDNMEMHALPMNRVLDILRLHGVSIRLISPDGWTASPGSYSYFATKD